jgi:hypothetical protein
MTEKTSSARVRRPRHQEPKERLAQVDQVDQVDQHRRWAIDPTEWALKVSGRISPPEELPDALCTEMGRRLLLAELEFSNWTLRRTERLDFVRDTSLTRRLTVDLNIRDDFPVFVDLDDREHWLVPLSLMRRQTLVNLEIRDLSGKRLAIPGMALTQQLDESILLAAAATVPGAPADLKALQEFVKKYVAGTHSDLLRCEKEIENPECSDLKVFFEDELFKAILCKFRHSRTQYVFLPKVQGRHRVVMMSFDEPADWKYHWSGMKQVDEGPWEYRPADPVPWYEPSHLAAGFGIIPTKIRFQVPAAENAASYQLEIMPPRGLGIVKANLLAGRPNDCLSRPVVVVANPQAVALHTFGVPKGSLCRAQVDLRIPTRGWLSKTLLSCAVVFGVLLSVLFHLSVFQGRNPILVGDAVRDAVVLLVATSAGVATMLAERDFRGFTAHLVSKLRILGATTVGLPIFVASLLIYGAANPSHSHQQLNEVLMMIATLVAFVLLAVTAVAWAGSWRDEKRAAQESGDQAQESGDQTLETEVPLKVTGDYHQAMEHYGHDRPAVGIRSAEAWHERFAWTNGLQKKAVSALRESAPSARAPDWCAVFKTACKNGVPGHQPKSACPAMNGSAGAKAPKRRSAGATASPARP